MRTYLKHETWGFSHWRNGVQIGASVGVTLNQYFGRTLSMNEARQWRRKKIFLDKS